MNKIYRLVWNRTLGIVQVATEFAKASRGGVHASRSVGSTPRRSRLAQACAAALLLGVGATALPVCAASTFTVTQANDSGNTAATGTLSWAIDQANANPGSTIDFNLPGGTTTISESGSLPALTRDTTFTASADVTIAGLISGSGHLTWAGTGTLTLAGDGTTLNGGASVDAGDLILGDGVGSTSVHGTGTSGAGVVVADAAALDVTTNSAVSGGVGAAGGYGNTTAPGSYGGMGGAGGAGVQAGQSTLTNSGAISGGAGGDGGTAYAGGDAGAGGNGVVGAGSHLDNSGSITGGVGGYGGYGYYINGGAGGHGGAGVGGAGLTVNNDVTGSITGGAGGHGGYTYASDASGHALGGAGGAGIDAGSGSVLTNAGTITGGTGGIGGRAQGNIYASGGSSAGKGGDGGLGGAGVGGSDFSLTNTGTIQGGAGGQGGDSEVSNYGAGGAGGVGVVATGGATVVNAGLIAGGVSGVAGDGTGGGSQADAVDFSGGGNTLELRAGYSFVGNVVSTSGTTSGGDTLALGGDVGGTFDLTQLVDASPSSYNGSPVFYGFAQLAKTGASTWTLTGASGALQGWNLLDGTLQVGDGSTTASIVGSEASMDGGMGVMASAGTNLGVGAGSSVQGGEGAQGSAASGYGGAVAENGGAGGAGVDGTGLTLANHGSIAGGAGGYGGTGGYTIGNYGGTGGIGGAGAQLDQSTITNDGSIAGGVGGTGGFTGYGGHGGDGGDGLTGTGFTLNNAGTVNGGAGGYSSSLSYKAGDAGNGGAGISGNGFSVGNTGMITGGAGGLGVHAFASSGASGTGGAGVTGSNFTLDNAGVIAGGAGGGYCSGGCNPLPTGGGGSPGPSFSESSGVEGSSGGSGVAGSGFQMTNTGTVQGGNGGNGGSAGYTLYYGPGTTSGDGANGGAGGAGIVGAGMTVTNLDTIQGGNGGNGGDGYTGYTAGIGGVGGAGVVSTGNSTIVNAGLIAGGVVGADGTLVDPSSSSGPPVGPTSAGGVVTAAAVTGTQADAVDLSGGGNTLELRSGYRFVGNVVSTSGTTNGGDTLALGGDAAGSFDVSRVTVAVPTASSGMPVYYGFDQYQKTGSSVWTLSGTDAVGLNWTITQGVLVGDTSSFGGDLSFAPSTANASGVTFQQDADGTYAGTVSGTGEVTKSGAGTLTFTGASTYTGGTQISAGTLQLGNGGTSGSIVGDVVNDGTLSIDRSDSVTLGGIVSGTGKLVQQGSGTTILTRSNTYTGGTQIGAGTLQLGSGGTSGSIVGDVANDGTLVFDRSDSVTFGGIVSGTGSLVQQGSGTMILTGANTYTGGTTIAAGTLQLGNGGTSGSVMGDIVNDGTLSFDRSDSVTFGGIVSGTGSLVQQGSGKTTMNGANTYTGGTTVQAGWLEIGDAAHPGAMLQGDVLVEGGQLGGHGTITGTVSNMGGMVMPGGSVGILTLAGDYVQGPNGTLSLEVTPDPTPGTGSSQLQVGGAASLDGTLAIVVDPGTYLANTSYDLVHAAGGVSGTFATTTINPGFAVYLTPQVSYSANDVTLTLSPNAAAYAGGYPNYASAVSLGMEQTFDAVLGRMGPTAQGRQGVWGQALAGLGGLGQSSRYQLNGSAAGYGHAVTDRFVLGFALSGGTTTTTVDAMQVRAKPFGGFVYGIWRNGGWKVSGSFGVGKLKQDSKRYLSALGGMQTAHGEGRYNGAALRLDYTAHTGRWSFTPYAGMDTVNARYDGVQEQGVALLALNYSKVSQHLSHYQAGVRIGAEWGHWQPWVQAGTEGWGGDRAITVTQSLGDYHREVTSSALPSNALSGGAGVTWTSDRWQTTLSWHGAAGHHYHGNSGMLQARYSW